MWTLSVAPPESPLTAGELAQFLKLDDISAVEETAILERYLNAATAVAEKYLNRSLDLRTFTLIYPAPLPYLRTVQPSYPKLKRYELPYTMLAQVNSVTVDTTAATYEVIGNDPAFVELKSFPTDTLTISYDAGYEYVPAAIEQGILQHAAYLYEHRGACDVTDAMHMSGAASLYRPYRIPAGMVL